VTYALVASAPPEPKKPKKRTRRGTPPRPKAPPERDIHRPHFARLIAWLTVHGLPSPEQVAPLAGRLGVEQHTLTSLCTSMRLSQSPDVALNLVAAALDLAARTRPAGSAPTVRSAGPDQVRLAFAALPPAQRAYAARMAQVTA